MDNNNNNNDDDDLINANVILPMPLIHHIFDTYMGTDYKLLIHKEGSSEEDRSKVLSIELIMMWEMEDYFKNVLLSLKFKSTLCYQTCKKGYVETLKWARENGCEWESYISKVAARNGHLDCLKWAGENGCEWDKDTCTAAARNGHLDCLKWARENGCPWDSNTCSSAAIGGHLNCLQWTRENGCPWESRTSSRAAESGKLNCLQWAVENGCPWFREGCLQTAITKNHTEMIRWIESTAL